MCPVKRMGDCFQVWYFCLFVWVFLRSQTVMGEKVNNNHQEISPRIQTNQNWNVFWLEMKKRKWVLRCRSKWGLAGGLGFGFVAKPGLGFSYRPGDDETFWPWIMGSEISDPAVRRLWGPRLGILSWWGLLDWHYSFRCVFWNGFFNISPPHLLFSILLESPRLEDTSKIKFYH